MTRRAGASGRGPAPGHALAPPGGPFAILHRPGAGQGPVAEILTGRMRRAERLDHLDLDGAGRADTGRAGRHGGPHTTLVLAPYRQIRERGFAAPDDGEPLLAMSVETQRRLPLAELMARLPDGVPEIEGAAFDTGDADYAAAVERIVRREIHAGEGSNFVLARSLRGRIRDFSRATALAALKRLLGAETGAYWTFLVHTGDRYLLGSTPEQHVRVRGDQVSMNPISGTYRYPGGGVELPGLLRFLRDPKETNELYMVVDEELKMMAALCERGVEVSGPSVKWMSRLAHTEYFLGGRSVRPLTEILRTTMPAPTVTGSPLENACRVISRCEPGGRGYYSGVIALVGQENRTRCLDSAILLRTADIRADGELRLTAGATIVRDSVPSNEAAETTAKVSGLLDALSGRRGGTRADGGPPKAPAAADSDLVRAALESRNQGMAAFWLGGSGRRAGAQGGLGPDPVRVTIVDAEDRFTAMLAYQLRSLGCSVRVVPWYEAEGAVRRDGGGGGAGDLLLLGPGPGDPTDPASPRTAALRSLAVSRLAEGRPLAAVCLGHQVVCAVLGLPVVRLPEPHQGRRMRTALWGRERLVGLYNSYTARADNDWLEVPRRGPRVEIQRRPGGEVVALRAPGLSTVQFHAESFLTEEGPDILRTLVTEALAVGGSGPAPVRETGGGIYEHV
ncbi:anthranilate synthase family protein [Streptomyces sp. NPDC006923]|uniref:anthranilate synthase family protein n=1 Tax=Streptomyces sp. NPDC006923 TaxID=3155355 RepID=UPI0034044311